jgi:hypothetical protein
VTLVDHALMLAERGLAVFPLKQRDKVPATRHGFKNATTDRATIQAHWEDWPEQNIGIATGELSGVFVLDVDGEDGEYSLAKLCQKHGPLPATVEAITGKGRHLYFRWADGLGSTAKRLGPGLDTRGNGGYVVAPPSLHPNGRAYRWSVDSSDEFADAPDWLLELLKAPPKPNGSLNGHADSKEHLLPPHILQQVQTAVEQGKRSEHCFRVMCELFELGLSDWTVQAIADGAPFAEKFWSRGDLLEEVTRARSRWALKIHIQEAPPALQGIDLCDFMQMGFPEREMVLGPIIPAKGLAMIYATRGVGKTHIGLGASFAVATGGKFLRWQAPQPRKVLHLDGEMPAAALQERLRWTMNGQSAERGMLTLLSSDLLENGLGNLARPQTQAAVDRLLNGVSLLTLDNLSSLTSISENESEGWAPIQDWLLRLRRRGVAVLLIHHAGKGGEQRGTSRREDVLDTSIALVHPPDYEPEQGARFQVLYKKARGIMGEAVKPFEAWLKTDGFTSRWTMTDVETATEDRVRELLGMGLSVRDTAEECGVSKSHVHRIKKLQEKETESVPGRVMPWDSD